MADHSDSESEALSSAVGGRKADVETERPERKRSLSEDLSDSSTEPSTKHQKTSASLAQDLFGTDDEEEDDGGVQGKKADNVQRKGSDADDSDDDRAGEENPDSSDVENDEGEREARPRKGANYTDLFGDEEDEEDRERSASRSVSPEVEKKIVDLEVANMGAPYSSENKLYLSRLPNFLNIDPRPFNPETYEEEVPNSEDTSLEENKTMKLKVGNTIRWRINAEEGKPPTYESNARFVRWSDGSLSLLVGSELFEATTSDILRDRQYLVAHHPKEGVLQTQAKFTTTMGFRPHTLQSGTHKMLTTAIMQKHKKTIRTKYVEMEGDPEQEKLEAEQRESERLKAQRRLEGSRRRTNARFAESGLTEANLEGDLSDDNNDFRRGRGSFASRGSRRSNSYAQNTKESEELDGYEEDEGFVVDDDEVEAEERDNRIMRAKRTQNKRKPGKPRQDSEDEDEDMSSEEDEAEDDEDESEQDEEEEEEELVVARKPKRAIAVAVDDEDD